MCTSVSHAPPHSRATIGLSLGIWTDFGILLDDSSHERVDFEIFRAKIQGKKEKMFSEQDLLKCILGGGESYCSHTLTYLSYVHVENQ